MFVQYGEVIQAAEKDYSEGAEAEWWKGKARQWERGRGVGLSPFTFSAAPLAM